MYILAESQILDGALFFMSYELLLDKIVYMTGLSYEMVNITNVSILNNILSNYNLSVYIIEYSDIRNDKDAYLNIESLENNLESGKSENEIRCMECEMENIINNISEYNL